MATKGEQLLDFIVVARTGPGPYPHPLSAAIHPAGRDTRMAFSLGPHAANVGGQVELARLLDGDGLNAAFAEEFDAGDLHWLVPYLVRLQAGEDVTDDEIVAAHAAKHGRAPKRMLQARHGA